MHSTTGSSSAHQTGTASIPTSPIRSTFREEISTAANGSGAATMGSSIGENGSVFTLTNIYTFGGDNNAQGTVSDHGNQSSHDKYHANSFIKSFDQNRLGHDVQEISQHYREQHSSSSITRRIHTTTSEQYDYDDNNNHQKTHLTHNIDTTLPFQARSSTSKIY